MTQGIELKVRSLTVRAVVELLSSMRFSISLLSVICIASVIGTVLKQGEQQGNYVNQFGPFWAEVFYTAGLSSVYSAWWFLLIMAALVTSTSLCVMRNTPKIIADLKAYKENIPADNLQAFGMRATAALDLSPEQTAKRMGQALVERGWRVKLQQRGDGWMLAAKSGAVNKLGYIAAHSAIVLVCLGGLLDGDVMLRAQMLFRGKSLYTGGGMMSDVPVQYRLDESNPTFRGNLMVPEGSKAATAVLSQPGGIVLQDLPFAIELKKFVVEYYSTGMPKLFASDIVIHDLSDGRETTARVEVNHPVSYKGVDIFQSGMDDGGSALTVQALPLRGPGKPFELKGNVGGSSPWPSDKSVQGEQGVTVEYTGLRVINVENLSGNTDSVTDSGVDVRKVDLRHTIESRLGSVVKVNSKKDLHNVGPSFSYKLRDAAGQATEFNNYMVPVDTGDGTPAYLLGVRKTPGEPYSYLRLPMDDQGGLDGFVRLQAALADPQARDEAVQAYAVAVTIGGKPEQAPQIRESAKVILATFAGAGPNAQKGLSGLQAVSDLIENAVPEAQRPKFSEVLLRMLQVNLFDLIQISRARAHLPALPEDEKTQAFISASMLAISDLQFYPAPMTLMLKDFQQVQASIFQVKRSPGQYIVYAGCAFLILGVFAMLYVRERRLWVWLSPQNTGTTASMALSTNRKTMDSEKEFSRLKDALLGIST